jgi:cytochrome b561
MGWRGAIMESNKNWHYDTITRLLHWAIAFLLIGLISLGWYMMSIEDQPNSGWYFNLHKSFGLIAAMLIFSRLIWRFTHKPAPLPSSVPYWQAVLSRAIHLLLYFCMIIMPITGFVGALYGKYGVVFFGIELPHWVNKSHDISKQFFDVHGVVAWILVGLVTLHILAAIKHLFINKDKVFQRMWM